MPTVSIEHLEIDASGVARVAGTRSRVINIVLDQRNGLTPEQIHQQYPHLALAQIHAALAYYYDHQQELDATIEREIREVQSLRDASPPGPTRRDLTARLQQKSGSQGGPA